MEPIAQILELLRKPQRNTGWSYDYESYIKSKCDSYNQSRGSMTNYNCEECKNRGFFMVYESGAEYMKECKCMEIRRNIERMKASGLTSLMKNYTFSTFIDKTPWQKSILESAKEYLFDNNREWFFIGGQVGCGKTHICTAMTLEFMNRGIAARYMLWRNEVIQIKAVVMDDEAYAKAVNPLKTIPVLYIDDFFKTERGKKPTTAEINIAFEILNSRYNNQDLITIISSELHMDDLLDIDEAVGSRIYQRTKRYCINISYDRAKNYRLSC